MAKHLRFLFHRKSSQPNSKLSLPASITLYDEEPSKSRYSSVHDLAITTTFDDISSTLKSCSSSSVNSTITSSSNISDVQAHDDDEMKQPTGIPLTSVVNWIWEDMKKERTLTSEL